MGFRAGDRVRARESLRELIVSFALVHEAASLDGWRIIGAHEYLSRGMALFEIERGSWD